MSKRPANLPPIKLEPGKFYRAHNQTTWCCIAIRQNGPVAICVRIGRTPLACTASYFTLDGLYGGTTVDHPNQSLTLMEEINSVEAAREWLPLDKILP